MKRPLRAFLLATTIIATPMLAQADPITLTAIAATVAGPALASALGGTALALIAGALLTAAITFAGQMLFGQDAPSQRQSRTREFDPHPPFRLALGEFPHEGSVVFHYARGGKYYLTILLNSVPSKDRCVERIEINDGIELSVAGLAEPGTVDGVAQDVYDMDVGGEATAPSAFGRSDDSTQRVMFWIGTGEQTKPPQMWLDEIGDVLEESDIWKGATVCHVRLRHRSAENAARMWTHGKPPPLKFFGKWAKLYDPRLDPASGVSQVGDTVLAILADPPADPDDGDAYIVAAPATGDWTGQEDSIATWDATVSPAEWTFAAPDDGDEVWNLDDSVQYTWDTSVSPSAWVAGQEAHDFDDRTTWEWSANPALAGLMVATHRFALGFDPEMIPIQQWADAADDADADFSSAATIGIAPENNRLHLEFEGENGATEPEDFIDSSPLERVPELANDVQISSATANSGATSMRLDLDGTADGLWYGDLETVEMSPRGNEFDFTVAVNPDSLSPQPTMCVFATYDSSSVRWYRLRVLGTGAVEFIGYGGAGPVAVVDLTSDPGVIVPGTWQTIRVWRKDDDWRLSVDGTVVAEELDHDVTLVGHSADLMSFKIGVWENNRDLYTGYIDDLQIVIDQTVETPSDAPWGCNGLVVIDQRELSLLDPVLACMAGHLDTTDGLLGVRAGVWVEPTETLPQPIGEEVDVRGARDGGFDTVRAKFISADREWEETDGQGWQLRAGSRVHPLQLPLVANPEQAARLEKITALRAEPRITVEGTWDGQQAHRRIGERVSFELFGLPRSASSFVITGKQVTTQASEDGLEFSVRLTLVEDLEATYAWSAEDFSLADGFTAPEQVSPEIDPPDSVTIAQSDYNSAAGATARLRVTVTISAEVAEDADRLRIEVTDGGGFTHLVSPDVEEDSGVLVYVAHLNPAAVGVTYTARARSESDALGVSDWVTSGDLTIVPPVLDFDPDDFSAEFA